MNLLKSTGTIAGLTLVSRIFGFARDIILARVLGAGAATDAWQLAFQLPNIFRRLFAEGAFSAAFVPLFNRKMAEDEQRSAAQNFAIDVLTVFVPILLLFSAILMLAMPAIIWFGKLFPLLLFLPGMLRDRLRSFIWLCFMSLMYFVAQVERVFAQPGDPAAIIGLSAVVILFCSAMMYVRWRARELKPAEPAGNNGESGDE